MMTHKYRVSVVAKSRKGLLLLIGGFCLTCCQGFICTRIRCAPQRSHLKVRSTSRASRKLTMLRGIGDDLEEEEEGLSLDRSTQHSSLDRRNFVTATCAAFLSTVGCSLVGSPLPADARMSEFSVGNEGKITKTGIIYFDAKVGEGAKPDWGKMCTIGYIMYGRSGTEGPLQKIDTSDNNGEPYLMKHGNGRQIRGLEEGIHTMKVGGKRRIIVPPNLGYAVAGLGPLPSGAFQRRSLNKVLDGLSTGGQLIFDVELLDVFDDEGDLGYYQDDGLTLDEVQQTSQVIDALLKGEAQMQALPGQLPTSQT